MNNNLNCDWTLETDQDVIFDIIYKYTSSFNTLLKCT